MKMSYRIPPILFTLLFCFISFSEIKSSEQRIFLFKKAVAYLKSHKDYQAYSQAIQDPNIAQKWIDQVAISTAHLNDADSASFLKETVDGFIKSFKKFDLEAIAASLQENNNDVFEEAPRVLTENERKIARRKHINKMRFAREETEKKFLIKHFKPFHSAP